MSKKQDDMLREKFQAFLEEDPVLDFNEDRRFDRRAIFLQQSPHYAEYMDLAHWIMKRHGNVRWRDDGQFFIDHSKREMRLCVFFDRFPIMGMESYMDTLAEDLKEDVTNLWADDELLVKLVFHFRKRYLEDKAN